MIIMPIERELYNIHKRGETGGSDVPWLEAAVNMEYLPGTVARATAMMTLDFLCKEKSENADIYCTKTAGMLVAVLYGFREISARGRLTTQERYIFDYLAWFKMILKAEATAQNLAPTVLWGPLSKYQSYLHSLAKRHPSLRKIGDLAEYLDGLAIKHQSLMLNDAFPTPTITAQHIFTITPDANGLEVSLYVKSIPMPELPASTPSS